MSTTTAKKTLTTTKKSAAAGKRRKPVVSKAARRQSDPTPDPLEDVEYGDNTAENAAAELTAMQKAYRERAAAESKRHFAATDSRFWFAVAFEDHEAKNRFLKAAGLEAGIQYITGDLFAAALGIEF